MLGVLRQAVQAGGHPFWGSGVFLVLHVRLPPSRQLQRISAASHRRRSFSKRKPGMRAVPLPDLYSLGSL